MASLSLFTGAVDGALCDGCVDYVIRISRVAFINVILVQIAIEIELHIKSSVSTLAEYRTNEEQVSYLMGTINCLFELASPSS